MQATDSSPKSGSVFLFIFGAVLVRPSLWPTALVQALRLVPRGWWRTAPFLPVPPSDYLEFRLVTQYGGGHGAERGAIRAHDVIDYLRWCRHWSREN
jgi:hypothetical protein